jgi:sigma-B regulation protein RsbU (phosphoserine phosphatase)
MERGRLLLPAPSVAVAGGLARRAGRFLLHTWPGRILLGAALVQGLVEAGMPVPEFLAGLVAVVLIVFAGVAAVRVSRWLVRRLLWRIRTKLIVSYLFIAVVPVVLLTAFFLLAGVLGALLVTSYMVGVDVASDADELKTVARNTLVGLPAGTAGLERFRKHLADLRAVHPGLRHALIREGQTVSVDGVPTTSRPPWLKEAGFAGWVQLGEDQALRGLWAEGDSLLVLDVPWGPDLFAYVERNTGLRLVPRREDESEAASGAAASPAPSPVPSPVPSPASAEAEPLWMTGVAVMPRTDWATGTTSLDTLALRFQPRALLRRLTPAPVGQAAPDILIPLLTGVGTTFLVLYGCALVVGLLLARSITRSVHALSQGTQRLRRGDFSRPIPVQSRDQLGELAESFNVMAADIQQLLRESADKQRLEEELRIARQIQMSLLPRDTVSLPGVRIAALCLPAAEVGGDYYDLLPLSDTRLGVLVADVSGKGTSAALYMAELKGLVLSLSRMYESPGRLLAEANRILSANMDSRSFITMTYAVVDVAARTLRFARAGHNPLIHREAHGGRTRVLAPAGMGLGMDAGERFEQVLEEVELPLSSGDVFVFFTDGLSEAMNERAELFGERRLRDLVERSQAPGSEEIKEAILAEIRAFVGEAAPHDDMTLVVLKVA